MRGNPKHRPGTCVCPVGAEAVNTAARNSVGPVVAGPRGRGLFHPEGKGEALEDSYRVSAALSLGFLICRVGLQLLLPQVVCRTWHLVGPQ